MKSLMSSLTVMSNNIEQITQQINNLKDGILHHTASQQPNASDASSTVGASATKASLQFSYASIVSQSIAESV